MVNTQPFIYSIKLSNHLQIQKGDKIKFPDGESIITSIQGSSILDGHMWIEGRCRPIKEAKGDE